MVATISYKGVTYLHVIVIHHDVSY